MRLLPIISTIILAPFACGEDTSGTDEGKAREAVPAPAKTTPSAPVKPPVEPQIGQGSMDELAKEFVQGLSDKDEERLLGLWMPDELWRTVWQCPDDTRDPFAPGIARAREIVLQGRLLPEAKKFEKYELTAIQHHGDEGDSNIPDLQPIEKGELAGKCTSARRVVKGWVRVHYAKIDAHGNKESDSDRLWMMELDGRWFQVGF